MRGGGGGAGEAKYLVPRLVRGLEIMVKRLVMGATVNRVGGLQCVITCLSWHPTLAIASLAKDLTSNSKFMLYRKLKTLCCKQNGGFQDQGEKFCSLVCKCCIFSTQTVFYCEEGQALK